jgi:plastocyanin
MRIPRLLVLTAALAACGGDGGTPPERQVASVTVSAASPSPLTSLGQTVSLSAQVRDAQNNAIDNATVTWSSSNSAVVSLSPTTGLSVTATAVSNGTSNITAAAGGKTSQPLGITVQQQLASVGFSPNALQLTPGETKTSTVSGRDARGNPIATGVTLQSFSSSDETKATVTASGNTLSVQGQAAGTARIRATLAQGSTSKLDSFTVTVTQQQPPPQTAQVTATVGSEFNPSSVEVAVGGTVTWTFEALHNVTFTGDSPPPPANIPDRSSGQVSRTFGQAGGYPYRCTIHPGMNGTVNVR